MEYMDEWPVDNIFEAAQNGFNRQVIRFLNARDSNINIRDGIGYTPLMRAVDEGHEDTVELLLFYGANSYIRSNSYYDSDASEDEMNEPNGETALGIAEQHGDTYIVRLIKNHQKKERLTRLIQSRHRDNLTRKKIKIQRAKQRLLTSRHMLTRDNPMSYMDYDTMAALSKYLY